MYFSTSVLCSLKANISLLQGDTESSCFLKSIYFVNEEYFQKTFHRLIHKAFKIILYSRSWLLRALSEADARLL